ncbi:MAG: transketolase [Candidatus Gottesmanbacteria bacterium GW2011_GWB1_43_11]|uniref:Transketolase n=1 Tax=Candidatus Gottesmanbacteria bacterium GW2011_GWB1_43_11 TaxID=1618446 RepID=A0A0G1CNX7_9BACT|nr:MAG: transketolase [Candidatus Gottesmanbacteria bacterium GW2011_GWA2_42_16]KKS56268.1 MAG: transketolase [Candidatus Gottesmanbacteria bacterium GW2011_GWA1_42_26]KKS82601.1 MAG: transketolase [Candidatus Gottesmanbacteria bacterium GW2011_GWC1_43_10]KKS87470.1 MAG: transketolase [Candidatus Gottesmanbacteria bacterium GW2011_GWB1_43_11]OGG10155.1 MAG: hypothetical protein A2699_01250 [Candidatus Gottesmanbacteria bacterium RIFCSPHIGHO2_01_FULL_43_15]HCM37638.1 hypothetical protein [Pates
MRYAFIRELFAFAKRDKRIFLVAGDLGYSVFEEFAKQYPRQYLNAGVLEQALTGMAAGLALTGKIPIIYSIVPFVTMRNFEQIRNDICYQNLNVKIVGVGAGFAYGNYARTHHGLEDIGVLRTLPNLTILCPGDPLEVALATKAALRHPGPVYLRLGKAGEPNVHQSSPRFKIGRGIVIKKGRDVTIIATSTFLNRGFEVMRKLQEQGLNTGLVSMPTIKPLDTRLIKELASKSKAIYTLEEHSIIGGLGSAVAEVLAESGDQVKFKRLGVPDKFTIVMGRQEYMRRANKLETNQIVSTILRHLKQKNS